MGPYLIMVDGCQVGEATSFWQAYVKADRLRAAGAELVRVYLEGSGRQGPVFALIASPDGNPQDDRVANTVDPALWDAVMAQVLAEEGDDG